MKSLTDIEKTIVWYRSLKKDFDDIDELLRVQRHLAGLLYEFARDLGGLYKQKNRAEFQRRAQFDIEKGAAIKAGDSAAKAESEAKAKNVEAMRFEFEADSEFKAGHFLYDAAGNVLQAMTQHISHLKAEKRAEVAGHGSQI